MNNVNSNNETVQQRLNRIRQQMENNNTSNMQYNNNNNNNNNNNSSSVNNNFNAPPSYPNQPMYPNAYMIHDVCRSIEMHRCTDRGRHI